MEVGAPDEAEADAEVSTALSASPSPAPSPEADGGGDVGPEPDEAAATPPDRATVPAPTAAGNDTPSVGSEADPSEDGGQSDGAQLDGSAPDSEAAPVGTGAQDAAEAPGGSGDAGEAEEADDAPATEVAPAAEETEATDADAVVVPAEPVVPQLSEAEAELAAQRVFRERIAQRKAAKEAPVEAGAKLSGQAADLLAAVRAVESGTKSGEALFASPPPPPRPAATAPAAAARPGAPEPVTGAAPPAPEAVASVQEVLADGGAPAALAEAVAATLGEQAGQVLRDDPWQLMSVPGVQPEQADGFARALLGAECGPGDERRTAALVTRLLERAALQGHTVLDATAVAEALTGHGVPGPDEALRHAIAEGVVLGFQDGADDTAATEEDEDGAQSASAQEPAEPVQVLLGLERYALAEESLAEGLARLVSTFTEAATWDTASASRSAAGLIGAVAGHGLVAHTGGEAARAEPAELVTMARGLGLRAFAASHSVDGARRLAAAVDNPAASVTLYGLLSGTEGPGRDDEGLLALDLLVVLDAPQLDVETAAILVESLPDATRLVLSGDPGVLPSAGAGRVFADLLAARACPQIASRTPDPGPIGELVSGIGIGELNQVEAPGKEVVIVPVRDAGEAVHRTVQLVADSVPRAFGVSVEQTQVITPGHGGSAGTRALNAALKQRLNPGPGRFGGFDPGDRIAHVPVPGRTLPGTIVTADADGLHLDCGGKPVVVPKDRVETTVRHGWALTAHQATGMRWPAVVVVLPGDAAAGLSRPWIYTAFSRGERHLSVVHGVDQALPHAVTEVADRPRTTRLRALLQPAVEPTA
ncbi:helix-hairpin-helix domain-containing protein [Streptomyces sp. A5-4]|uniref:helix-hairpin-helix domain-containing protein n=1 Tax=Streptomyces sp. A5-4 TaxID=3384771 RepID=UPI003DA999A4